MFRELHQVGAPWFVAALSWALARSLNVWLPSYGDLGTHLGPNLGLWGIGLGRGGGEGVVKRQTLNFSLMTSITCLILLGLCKPKWNWKCGQVRIVLPLSSPWQESGNDPVVRIEEALSLVIKFCLFSVMLEDQQAVEKWDMIKWVKGLWSYP